MYPRRQRHHPHEWCQQVQKADERKVPAYAIAANKTLLELVQVLPTTGKSLAQVGGFGKKRLADHGTAVLDIITNYVQANQLSPDLMIFASSGAPNSFQPFL